MTLKSTVETITHTALNTAVTAVRDPRGTAAKATGLVLETAGAGIGLVRGRIGGAAEQAPAPVKEVAEDVVDKAEDVVTKVEEAVPAAAKRPAEKKTPASKPAAEKPAETKPAEVDDPRDHIPGPDLAAFAPPAPEDLPEPIVIEAE